MSRSPSASASGGKQKQIIVVAGEGDYDREVLKHLLQGLLPGSCPEVVAIKSDKAGLSQADKTLAPRVDTWLRLAKGMAVGKRARLAGFVIHVDFDAVADEAFTRVRERISAELKRAFAPSCPSAVALAASATEGWLMLFPEAFPSCHATWRLPESESHRDIGQIPNAKVHLKRLLKQPEYHEKHAPKIMRAAAEQGLVTKPSTRKNRSFSDFTSELATWPKFR